MDYDIGPLQVCIINYILLNSLDSPALAIPYFHNFFFTKKINK